MKWLRADNTEVTWWLYGCGIVKTGYILWRDLFSPEGGAEILPQRRKGAKDRKGVRCELFDLAVPCVLATLR